MTFLWHLRGSVALDGGPSNEAALRRVRRLLQKQYKPVTEEGADFVAFDLPLWRDPHARSWKAMVIYDHGRFWLEQGQSGRRLHYDLSSLHSFVFCALVATIAFLVGAADAGLTRGLQFAAVAFGWLYGMNVLQAVIRVPMAVRRAVREP